MTMNEQIIQAVTPVVPTCVPEPYQPDEGEAASEYCTFSYTETPDNFGDDDAGAIRCLIRLNYYAPLIGADGKSNNTLATRKALRRAIAAAGFTHPSVEPLTDEVGQRYEFEFEGLSEEV